MNDFKKPQGRPRKDHGGVQVIRVQAAEKPEENDKDWEPTKMLTDDIVKLANEVEALIDDLIPKMNDLNNKIVEAYSGAPLKDCGLNSSPLAPFKVIWNLKRHMIKNGLQIDNTYLSDINKVPKFKDYIKDSVQWLLKFS